jgi:uncharacterized protein (DUF305 family)
MTALSFIAMYVLMYAMVDRLSSAIPNWNQAYMAALMTSPMLVLELLLMHGMYADRRLNVILLIGGLVLGVVSFAAIRQQTLIKDRQFLRSMIPHHSGAILMCLEARISDPEIRALCRTIVASQRQEVDQMRGLLARSPR